MPRLKKNGLAPNTKAWADLETEFWALKRAVRPDDDLKPLNLREEMKAFFDARRNGKAYNPQFRYRSPSDQRKLDAARHIAEKTKTLHPKPYFAPLVQELCEWIGNFRGRSSAFPSWLYSVYGRPDEKLTRKARAILDGRIDFREEPVRGVRIGAAAAVAFFQTVLEGYGFLHWRVEIQDMPAKVAVDSAEERILVGRSDTFTDIELKRLAAHEVGTHVVRYENGKKQPSEVFRYGFPGYLACEEGLAVRSEERTGFLSSNSMRKYALRVIACELAFDNSFSAVFEQLSSYAPEDSVFSIVMRVKRGLENTGENYGYTKDLVYLLGYCGLQGVAESEIAKLYVGKIGFSELRSLDFDKLDMESIIIPNWWKGEHGLGNSSLLD